jgi:hypothetical protein
MSFKTYQQLEDKILLDLDLQDENMISTGAGSEMMGYCNDAIHEAESIIHSLCEDYFLSTTTLSLVATQADYSFPSDIYADKIRRLLYSNGSTIYAIKRIRTKDVFERIAVANRSPNTNRFEHILINTTASGRKIRFVPTPQASETDTVIVWYIRNATQVSAVSDTVDIPEFSNFVEKYMKKMCLAKEGHPGLAEAIASLEAEKQLMIQALTNREPDTDDELEMDMSFYQEHV